MLFCSLAPLTLMNRNVDRRRDRCCREEENERKPLSPSLSLLCVPNSFLLPLSLPLPPPTVQPIKHSTLTITAAGAKQADPEKRDFACSKNFGRGEKGKKSVVRAGKEERQAGILRGERPAGKQTMLLLSFSLLPCGVDRPTDSFPQKIATKKKKKKNSKKRWKR